MNRRTATTIGLGIAGALAAAEIVRRRRHARDDTPLATVEPGTRSNVETSDGAVLEVDIVGEGPTVVLVHGWTESIEVWTPVTRGLVARGFRVVRYNHRGHGSSTMGAPECDMARLGTDLREVLEATEAKEVVLVGHSMGGMASQAFAIAHPDVLHERVRALVLVSTAASGMGAGPIAAVAPAIIGSPLLDRAMSTPRGARLVRGVFGRKPSPAAVRSMRDMFVATPPAVRVELMRACMGMDLRAGLPTIDVATTVVCGVRDTLTPMSRSREIAGLIPGARLVELPTVGHMLPYEATERVADLIAEAHSS